VRSNIATLVITRNKRPSETGCAPLLEASSSAVIGPAASKSGMTLLAPHQRPNIFRLQNSLFISVLGNGKHRLSNFSRRQNLIRQRPT
jgi:hypothetical protein